MAGNEKGSLSLREFAKRFDKDRSWAYRQVYEQKVKVISEFGRMRVPLSEVERIEASAEHYRGKKKAKKKAAASEVEQPVEPVKKAARGASKERWAKFVAGQLERPTPSPSAKAGEGKRAAKKGRLPGRQPSKP